MAWSPLRSKFLPLDPDDGLTGPVMAGDDAQRPQAIEFDIRPDAADYLVLLHKDPVQRFTEWCGVDQAANIRCQRAAARDQAESSAGDLADERPRIDPDTRSTMSSLQSLQSRSMVSTSDPPQETDLIIRTRAGASQHDREVIRPWCGGIRTGYYESSSSTRRTVRRRDFGAKGFFNSAWSSRRSVDTCRVV